MPRSLRSPQQQRFQDLLITARKDAGMTQAEVAAQLKRPQSYVAKYEGGERRLDVVEFVEVANVLRCDPTALLQLLISDWKKPVKPRKPR